ncbi:protein ALP1-like [Ixodes scapularis]
MAMSRQNLLAAAVALIEDESDDELDDIIALASIVSARTDRNRVPLYYEKAIDTYFDFEFMRLFRLSRETHAELAGRYEASAFYPDSVGGRPPILAEKTLLIVLSYVGTRATMYQIADRFDITESSVHLCIERVLNFLNSISAQIITWPDQERRRRSQAGFLRKTKGKGPHKTIGAIDGCHVEILRPTESPNSYYNRSKFHSIVLQGICDDQNQFIDVYIGFPGSAHDARILKESPIFEDAEAKCAGGYLLGDSAYPLLPYVMTPFRSSKAALPSWKTTYNTKHGQQRVTIENTFGLLKQRFRRMYLVDSASIRQCCLVVMGACVLHNLCNAERDFFDDLNNTRPPDQVTNDDDHAIQPDDATRSLSERIREAIAKTEC